MYPQVIWAHNWWNYNGKQCPTFNPQRKFWKVFITELVFCFARSGPFLLTEMTTLTACTAKMHYPYGTCRALLLLRHIPVHIPCGALLKACQSHMVRDRKASSWIRVGQEISPIKSTWLWLKQKKFSGFVWKKVWIQQGRSVKLGWVPFMWGPA